YLRAPNPAAGPAAVLKGGPSSGLAAGQKVGALGEQARTPPRRLIQEDEALPKDEGVEQHGARLRCLGVQSELSIEAGDAFQSRRVDLGRCRSGRAIRSCPLADRQLDRYPLRTDAFRVELDQRLQALAGTVVAKLRLLFDRCLPPAHPGLQDRLKQRPA